MNKKIEAHVNELFSAAPRSAKVAEIKEELLGNLQDKYLDLLDEGKSEEEAYRLVISGIGDIDDLLHDFTVAGPYSPAEDEKKRSLKNLFLSVGVAIYVLSLAIIMLFDWFGLEEIGMVMMIICWAVATGLIVYGVNTGKTRYQKRDDTFVERYKEKTAEDERTANLKKAVSSALWPLIVVIYLALSFISGGWAYTWIIFPLGAFAQQGIHLLFFAHPGEKNKLWQGMFWTGTVVLYLIISFSSWGWGWSWMIFLVAVAVQQIIRLLMMWRDEA